MRHRIAHVGWNQVVGMFRVYRNYAEHIHVLVQNNDLLLSLYDLQWKETGDGEARYAGRQAQSRWIVDAAFVERLENFFRGPGLVRRGGVYNLLRRGTRRSIGITARAAHTQSGIRFVPTSAPRAAALPDTCEVGFSVRHA